MNGPQDSAAPVKFRAARLIGLMLATVAAASAAGGYPTWRAFGSRGLSAAAWAVGLNAAIFGANAAAVCLAQRRRGALAAGKVFAFGGAIRMVLLLAIGAALMRTSMVFWGWAVSLYVVLLMIEAAWVGRFLNAQTRQAMAKRDADDPGQR